MGTYHQLHFATELVEDTPLPVIETLLHMVGDMLHEPEPAITHPLFGTDRWRFMLRGDSCYFAAEQRSTFMVEYGHWFLTVQSSFKNYDHEIDKFVDWITPYTSELDGEFLGYYRHEHDPVPTLILKNRPNQLAQGVHGTDTMKKGLGQ